VGLFGCRGGLLLGRCAADGLQLGQRRRRLLGWLYDFRTCRREAARWAGTPLRDAAQHAGHAPAPWHPSCSSLFCRCCRLPYAPPTLKHVISHLQSHPRRHTLGEAGAGAYGSGFALVVVAARLSSAAVLSESVVAAGAGLAQLQNFTRALASLDLRGWERGAARCVGWRIVGWPEGRRGRVKPLASGMLGGGWAHSSYSRVRREAGREAATQLSGPHCAAEHAAAELTAYLVAAWLLHFSLALASRYVTAQSQCRWPVPHTLQCTGAGGEAGSNEGVGRGTGWRFGGAVAVTVAARPASGSVHALRPTGSPGLWCSFTWQAEPGQGRDGQQTNQPQT
jgi:hypothetical protein